MIAQQHKSGLGWPVKPEITPAGLYLSAAVANGTAGDLHSPTLASSFKSGGSAFTQVESKLVKVLFMLETKAFFTAVVLFLTVS